MAGVDKDFAGEAFPAAGTRIGHLPQEPHLDPTKNVLQHVEEAVAEKRKILERYEEISANYSDETADEFARLQDQIDAQNLWDLDKQVEIAMDALRLPPGDADVTTLSGGERRRVALCRLLLQPSEYTIEMRHAPFFWWIQDLSAKDPIYITPIIMGATMVIQQKMTPRPLTRHRQR